MSIVAGAIVGQTLAIGSDSMSTWGAIKETPALVFGPNKFLVHGDSIIGVVGSVADYHVLHHYLENEPELEAWTSTESLFRFMLRFHSALKEQYSYSPDIPNSGGFESSGYEMLIGNPTGLYGVYPQRSVSRYKRFYAFGSGFEVAMGAMHHAHGCGGTAKEVVLAGLRAAIELDDSCGGDPLVRELTLQHTD